MCSKVVHTGVKCSECSVREIIDLRYVCGHCKNYNLCSMCYRGRTHDRMHVFVVLDDPFVITTQNPLLNKLVNIGHFVTASSFSSTAFQNTSFTYSSPLAQTQTLKKENVITKTPPMFTHAHSFNIPVNTTPFNFSTVNNNTDNNKNPSIFGNTFPNNNNRNMPTTTFGASSSSSTGNFSSFGEERKKQGDTPSVFGASTGSFGSFGEERKNQEDCTKIATFTFGRPTSSNAEVHMT